VLDWSSRNDQSDIIFVIVQGRCYGNQFWWMDKNWHTHFHSLYWPFTMDWGLQCWGGHDMAITPLCWIEI